MSRTLTTMSLALLGFAIALPQPARADENERVILFGRQVEKEQNDLHAAPGRVKETPKRPEGRIPLLSSVTKSIEDEAKAGWAENEAWPRKDADFAAAAEDGLADRQIIVALLKRQHSHHALDGYIRWQLLSFAPDLKEASSIQLRRMIMTMPGLTRLPAPPPPKNVLKDQGSSAAYFFSGTQKAFVSDLRPVPGAGGLSAPQLGVLNSGSSLGQAVQDPEEVLRETRGAAYDFMQTVPKIEHLNTPAIHYRTALINKLPSDGGLKLEALYQDLEDRLEAGDPGWKDAAQAFYDEAAKMRADESIPPRTRQKLVNQMRELGKKKVDVVHELKIDDAGNMKVSKIVCQFPPRHLPALLENLAGVSGIGE